MALSGRLGHQITDAPATSVCKPNCKPTTRHSAASDITSQHCQEQLTYDALRILDFNADALGAIGAEMQFLRELAHAGKIAQGRI